MKYLLCLVMLLVPAVARGEIVSSVATFSVPQLNESPRLYCPGSPEGPRGHKYILIVAEQKQVPSSFIYTSCPPMYPAEWVLRAYYLDNMDSDLLKYKDSNIVGIVEIGRIFTATPKYKTVEETTINTREEFEGFEVKE